MQSNRVLIADIARTLCVLEIVAFWHILDYCEPIENQSSFGFVTQGVLACFTFLSGLFNGKKRMSALSFYKSRLIRFFPLLLLSLACFYVCGIVDLRTLILSACGLSCFIPPQPYTLWFFSMIIIFYLVTPLLLRKLDLSQSRGDMWRFAARSLLVYAALGVLYLLIDGMDLRLLYYYPFYVLGIACPIKVVQLVPFHKIKCFAFGVGIILASLMLQSNQLIYNIINMGGVILCLLSLSAVIEGWSSTHLKKFFLWMAYASMAAYLFHRELYGAFKVFFANSTGYLPLWVCAIMVVVLFGCAYIVQSAYDRVVARLASKRT